MTGLFPSKQILFGDNMVTILLEQSFHIPTIGQLQLHVLIWIIAFIFLIIRFRIKKRSARPKAHLVLVIGIWLIIIGWRSIRCILFPCWRMIILWIPRFWSLGL